MAKPETPRVVLDCNVMLVAAAKENSMAAACLWLARSGYVRLYLSRPVLEEIEDVLNRPGIRRTFDRLTDELVKDFLAQLREVGQLVRRVPHKFIYPRDKDDEPYVNLAGAVGAHYIVSRDKDLLSLNTGHSDECREFRQRFRPLKVIEPLDLLRIVALARNLSVTELRAEHEASH